jgi:hypothetical protein
MRSPSMLRANSAIKRTLDRLQSADLISAWPLLHGNFPRARTASRVSPTAHSTTTQSEEDPRHLEFSLADVMTAAGICLNGTAALQRLLREPLA